MMQWILAFAQYDLTDYGVVRAVGIIASLVAALIVLAVTIRSYRNSAPAKDAEYGGETETQSASEETSFCENAEETGTEEKESFVTAEEETPETVTEEEIPITAAEEIAEETAPAVTVTEAQPEQEVQTADASTASVVPPVAAAEAQTAESAEESLSVPSYITRIAAGLEGGDKEAFQTYVIDGAMEESTRVRKPVGLYAKDEEDKFLRDFFMSVGKYRKVLSSGVIEKLYKRYLPMQINDYRASRLNYKMISVYFYRRKIDEDALSDCIKLCKKDIDLNINVRKVHAAKIPSLKRLILIYSAEKNYDKAIEYCDLAIEHDIIDMKETGFEPRKDKLIAKKEKQAERERKRLAKLNKGGAQVQEER